MSGTTAIEWTERTWNPTTGCDKVSPGCDHCYALTLAKRLKGMGSVKYQNDGDPITSGPGFLAVEHESELAAPLHWRKPAKVFVNSMSDLFHERISDEFIAGVFGVMALASRHTFQVLTKRHARMRSLLSRPWFFNDAIDMAGHYVEVHPDDFENAYLRGWPLRNVWLGVSVEDQKWADIRIPALLDTPAAVRFLSCEPLIGPIDLVRWFDTPLVCGCGSNPIPGNGSFGCCAACMQHEPSPIDWVIVGGESGPGARPMHRDRARSLRDQCAAAGVPFLFKQWGEWRPADTFDRPARPVAYQEIEPGGVPMVRVGKKAAGRVLDGRTHDDYPTTNT